MVGVHRKRTPVTCSLCKQVQFQGAVWDFCRGELREDPAEILFPASKGTVSHHFCIYCTAEKFHFPIGCRDCLTQWFSSQRLMGWLVLTPSDSAAFKKKIKKKKELLHFLWLSCPSQWSLSCWALPVYGHGLNPAYVASLLCWETFIFKSHNHAYFVILSSALSWLEMMHN